jgi:hypothetical protein
MFDLCDSRTLAKAKFWKTDIDAKVRLQDSNESPIPVVLLANKVYI